jgi:hypothetical protein
MTNCLSGIISKLFEERGIVKGLEIVPFGIEFLAPGNGVENSEGSIFRPFTSIEGTLPSSVQKKKKKKKKKQHMRNIHYKTSHAESTRRKRSPFLHGLKNVLEKDTYDALLRICSRVPIYSQDPIPQNLSGVTITSHNSH